MKRPRPLKRTWERIEERSTTAGRISETARWVQIALLAISAFFFFGVMLWVGGRLLLNTATIPDDAAGVLQSAQRPEQFGYELQTVRKFKLVDQDFERQSVQLVSIDSKNNKYQGRIVGLSERPVEFASDGKQEATRYIQTGNQDSGGGIVTQGFQSYEGPSLDDLFPPAPEDITRNQPKITSETASYRGVQAWKIEFKPDPILLNKLFPDDKLNVPKSPLVVDDLQQINEKKYEVSEAYALVTRETRQMLLLTIRVELENGHGYRFLLKYQNFNQVDLSEYKLEEGQ